MCSRERRRRNTGAARTNDHARKRGGMAVLRIRDWSETYENSRSREIKNLSYVCMPNSHDGSGYAAVLDHEHGPCHFGAWCAIVQVASKCKPRGVLVRGN